jgi:Transposase DDE domain
MNMPTEAFLTVLYIIVDDWYQLNAPTLLAGKAGTKPLFSDSEVITLSLAQHWMGVPDEREFLRRVRNDWLPLFPRLVSQSQFNRRARNLCWLIHRMRQHLVEQMGLWDAPYQVIDGTPVHLRHWRRYGKGHLLLPEAALGYCAAKKETYYGFRLLALTTREGIITDWNLFPANLDERAGAQELLSGRRGLCILGDKGFLDHKRQTLLAEDQGVRLLTPKRHNQQEQHAPGWDARMSRVRRVIETAFAQVKDTFGLERPGARSVWGTLSRVIAKLTGMTLAAFCNRHQGVSPLRLAEFAF